MDETGGTKLTGIRQIVRLKEILKKWQSVTINPPRPAGDKRQSGTGAASSSSTTGTKHGGNSPAVNKKLLNVKKRRDSEEGSPGSPPDVPKGYLAVYVGPELRRFIIPTSYLSHPLFKRLLEKTEEEYGFDHSGALTIPCEVETFKYLIRCIESHIKDQPDDSSDAELTATEE